MHLKANLFIFSLLFFSQFQFIHAQSKKEQIEVLNVRLDSLNRVLENERGISNQKLQVYENEIRDLKSQLSKIQLGLANTNKELKTLKIANDSLVSLTDSLQIFTGLGTSKLDKEIFIWLKEKFYVEGRWRFCNMNYDDGGEKVYNDLEELNLILSEVNINYRDINKDGILDAIVSISVPWCAFTTAFQRSYGILIYSKENEYLKLDNESLSKDVYDKLYNELKTKNRLKFHNLLIWGFTSFSGPDGSVSGSATIWLDDDPHCCASFSADIIYNPFTGQWSYELKKNR
jgi:hypothetical protein